VKTSGEVQTNTNDALDDLFSKLKEKDMIADKFKNDNSNLSLKNMGFKYPIIIGVSKLLERSDKIIDDKFTQEDFTSFIVNLQAYYSTTELEVIKDVFARMLKPQSLGFDQNEKLEVKELGTIIGRVADKLYPSDQTKNDNIRKLFLVDFRNAIVHRDYVFQGGILTYANKKGEQFHLDSDGMKEMSTQIHTIDLYIAYKARSMP